MGNVIAYMSMSLDGFIAGPNDDVDQVFSWSNAGDTEYRPPGGSEEEVFKVAPASADFMRETWPDFGAVIVGRRTFDLSQAWGGKPPLGLPHIVVTHHPPAEWVKDDSPFTFVTDGVASAVQRAKQAAGGKHVTMSGASVIQQCLNTGLLDEIHIDLVPVLLGAGIRMLDNLDATRPRGLEITRVVEGRGVTHLRFRVLQ
jgi:dihydrofolate reductase